MRISSIIASALLVVACSTAEPMSERMVRSQMQRCPEANYLDFLEGTYKWNYTTGLELKSFLDVYAACSDTAILGYVERWYDTMVQEDGSILTYSKSKYSTDHICPGRSLFALYDITGKQKYRMAADTLFAQIKGHPRTSEGAFWHKLAYPNQIWLDGVYMAGPFYAEYAARYLEGEAQEEAFAEVAGEFIVAAKHTYDPATKLYRHAWDESRSMFWCDPTSGQSEHCWGRALGWYCMAAVDVLEIMPEATAGRDSIISILRGIYEELPKWADPETGMWYQVLDQPGREGNYLEATCSAMFSYALLKGVRLGYLDASLSDYARKTYEGVCSTFISTDEAGLTSIDACCSVGGLGGKQMRKGDFDYYLSEPVRSNDPKGTGPFIWASLEKEKLK